MSLLAMETKLWNFLQADANYASIGLTTYKSSDGQVAPFDTENLIITGPLPCAEGGYGDIKISPSANGTQLSAAYKLRFYVAANQIRSPRQSIEAIFDTVRNILLSPIAYRDVLNSAGEIYTYSVNSGGIVSVRSRDAMASLLWICEFNLDLVEPWQAFTG